MAGRIRTIKPEILDDEIAAGLSDAAWRVYVSIWLEADDYGNLAGNKKRLHARFFWAGGGTRDMDAIFRELAPLVQEYSVRGQSYVHVGGWHKHQKVDKPGKPHVPGPDQADSKPPPPPKKTDSSQTGEVDSRDPREPSVDSRDTLATLSRKQENTGQLKDSRHSRDTLAPDPDQYPDQDQDHHLAREGVGAAPKVDPLVALLEASPDLREPPRPANVPKLVAKLRDIAAMATGASEARLLACTRYALEELANDRLGQAPGGANAGAYVAKVVLRVSRPRVLEAELAKRAPPDDSPANNTSDAARIIAAMRDFEANEFGDATPEQPSNVRPIRGAA